jgi:hypothetical protein
MYLKEQQANTERNIRNYIRNYEIHNYTFISSTTEKKVIIRSGAFMLTVLARLTLSKTNDKKFSVLLSWFSGTPYTGTQPNRSDKMHC